MDVEKPNCIGCHHIHPDNGNCTAVGGFCTAVPAAHCPLIPELRAELEKVMRERDAAVKDIELIVRRINDCNIKLDDGTTVSSLELGRCRVCKHEETGDCDDGGCIFEWRGPKKEN